MADVLAAAKDLLRAQRAVDMARKDGGPDQQKAYRFRSNAFKALKAAVDDHEQRRNLAALVAERMQGTGNQTA